MIWGYHYFRKHPYTFVITKAVRVTCRRDTLFMMPPPLGESTLSFPNLCMSTVICLVLPRPMMLSAHAFGRHTFHFFVLKAQADSESMKHGKIVK